MISMLTWIMDLFRTIISLLDRMVYWGIELLVFLFNEISKINLFAENSKIENSTDFISLFADRIYIIVAIVMIFKVSFSIIQYIINPDTFSDKERGMANIIKNILITLVCLAGVKSVFNMAYDLQRRIVDNHIIETLILGMDGNLVDDKSTTDGKTGAEKQADISNNIPFTILSSFITLNTTGVSDFKIDADGDYICKGIKMSCSAGAGRCPNKNDSNGRLEYYKDSDFSTEFINCINLSSKEGNYPSTTIDTGNGTLTFEEVDTGNIYAAAHDYYNYNLLLDLINHKWENNPDVYIFDYKFIISTIAGVFVAIIYLNFCIDLAVRTVKFAFLQLIAPIPILSMIDPKSSKNGMMSKWVKACLSTYLGLFIRIAAVSFVVFLISLISTNQTVQANMGTNGFVKLFIIFGALMFAKELPKLISDLTGINLSGDFKLNPLTRLPGGKLATNVAKGAGLAAGAAIGTTAAVAGRGVVGGLGAGIQAGLHKANPNLFKKSGSEVWAGASHDMLNRLSKGGNSIAGNLTKPFGLNVPKIPEHTMNKDIMAARQTESAIQRGQKLAEKYASDKYAMYKDDDFREAVQTLDDNRTKMYDAQNVYDDLVRRKNAGENITTEQINDAKANAGIAQKNFEYMQDRVKSLGTLNSGDYGRYKDFKAYEDKRKAMGESTSSSGGHSTNSDSMNVRVRRVNSTNGPRTINVRSRAVDNNPSTPFDPSNMDG